MRTHRTKVCVGAGHAARHRPHGPAVWAALRRPRAYLPPRDRGLASKTDYNGSKQTRAPRQNPKPLKARADIAHPGHTFGAISPMVEGFSGRRSRSRLGLELTHHGPVLGLRQRRDRAFCFAGNALPCPALHPVPCTMNPEPCNGETPGPNRGRVLMAPLPRPPGI